MRSVAIVTTRSPDGTRGGAEALYEGLIKAFQEANWDVTEIPIEFDESSYDKILEGYQRAKMLDLLSFDLVVSTKAPTYMVWHPNHACWLVHTIRVFYDLFDRTFPDLLTQHLESRRKIFELDTAALGRPGVRRFTIGETVSDRLTQYNHLDSVCLHPPSRRHGFFNSPAKKYFFTVSRLHEWKRLDLLIRAVKLMQRPIELRIAGVGPDEKRLKELAEGSNYIKFLGNISDDELYVQYANCLAVPFVPLNEDYGYVTIEAFLSTKPVVTVQDSGEPAKIVKQAGGGLVCRTDPASIAGALSKFASGRGSTKQMGRRGFEWAQRLQWSAVVEKLAAARPPYKRGPRL